MDEKYLQIIVENTESCKSAHHRIDKLELELEQIKELTIAVKEVAMETKATREDVNDIKARVKSIEEKPVKNWENLIKTIITGIATAILGYFFAKFGM